MNSKRHLYNEAERLYVINHQSMESIANMLNLNRKTVMKWKEEGDWHKRQQDYLKSKQSFHEELFEFARKLMKDITADLDAGEKIDTGRMYAFCRVLPMFAKVKDYEDVVAKHVDIEDRKGLTPDFISKIEEEILGIPRKQNIDNDNQQ